MTTPKSSKTCFVISPIGSAEGPTRKRSDDIFKFIITPAVERRGYSVIRADMISKPGMITSDIVNYLLNAELVVADITDHNPNVFYELAVRHAVKKPVIQIILDGQSIPFDIAQSRTIFYKYPDLESANACQDEIVRQIDAIERDPEAFDNPLSMAITLERVRESDNPLGKSVAEILSMLQDIRQDIAVLPRAVGSWSETSSQLSLFGPESVRTASGIRAEIKFVQSRLEDFQRKLIELEDQEAENQEREDIRQREKYYKARIRSYSSRLHVLQNMLQQTQEFELQQK